MMQLDKKCLLLQANTGPPSDIPPLEPTIYPFHGTFAASSVKHQLSMPFDYLIVGENNIAKSSKQI